MGGVRRLLALSVAGLLATQALACAADPLVTRWADRWLAVERAGLKGDPEAITAFDRLAEHAPSIADADAARFGKARALRAQSRRAEAFALLDALGDQAMRRLDRARARVEMARMALSARRLDEATALFRQVVETYPYQPAATRSVQLLRHLAETRGVIAERDALTWLLKVYPILAKSPVGDDLVYQGIEILYRWWRRSNSEVVARHAEALVGQLEANHYVSGHWDDALWIFSRMLHHQGRYDDEIRVIGRLLDTREEPLFVGHYDTTYHWVGQLRIARIQMIDQQNPALAAETYAWFIKTFPYSRWRDDARFWQGCALLRAGDRMGAEAAFQDIAAIYADSKYLRRLDDARANPHSALCEPKVFEEGSW